MSVGDTIAYLLVGNPISQTMISTLAAIAKSAGIAPKKIPQSTLATPLPPLKLSNIAGFSYNFIRLAGLSGASAIIMGAYGKYALQNFDDAQHMEARMIFDGAQRFHFLHSLAFLAMPLTHRPSLTGTLMAIGTILFSGPMYYRAFSGDKRFIHISTFGGFCLIAAWLSLLF